MKNTIKILGIIAFIAIIGFSMVSCNEDEDDSNSNSLLIGTWIKGEIELSFMTNGWVASVNGQIGDIGESYNYDGKTLVLNQSGETIRGNATISGNKMTISGFTNEASILNGVWTKQ
jgi:hypothetical protein